MARTDDPNSATAQFFINVKDNDFLDQAQARDGDGYAVFGKVVAGMDVVDKIRADDHRPGRDVPPARRRSRKQPWRNDDDQVALETNTGQHRIELDDEKAPERSPTSSSNVNKGHYDGTVFHRVIKAS